MRIEQFQYLILLGLCLLVTLPLELVLGARVWRRPLRLLMALVPTVVLFSIWDVWGIVRAHWSYSESTTTGWMIGTMPVEELAFFLVVPICGLLTLEAVGRVLELARRLRARGRARAPGGER